MFGEAKSKPEKTARVIIAIENTRFIISSFLKQIKLLCVTMANPSKLHQLLSKDKFILLCECGGI